ncbi:pyruvate dehydrogenase E2 component (dihydrolipoamide acetyltransferase) [Flavobacterium swingsii]|uniref:Dihydrolipoamide acetyltransferase component of pyruvate dehydrogenase complex n=1 Tax=Flavobacterium swingsii TaxID=498292 RepID=A0A1I0Z043_9FLAO|nr:dihydrolipoamide acetyltransferase family protein [Flavobacterium swingsii]SFB18901.1 pyruvate dehydrogenase E2 component (dihydrolipoamide acetyltransferase) [Flavobacterium swingsii]
MATVITMPRLSDTMTEGTVATWLKKVGDKVSEGDILAEIETDKATMEFESFNSGTLLYIGIPEGESAPVDSLLAIIGKEGEDISALLNGNPVAAKTEAAPEVVTPNAVEEQSKSVSLPKGVVVVTMPRLSDTMTDGTVATWLKKVGDKVAEGDILAEIETDKATMEFESFNAGTLLFVGINEGESAPVDSVLAIIGPEGTDIAGIAENYKKGGNVAAPVAEKAAEVPNATSNNENPTSNSTDRVFASPLAKKIAQDKGINLSQVKGSGENGRIVKGDVEGFTPQAAVQQAVSTSPVTNSAASVVKPFVPAGEKFSEEIKNSQMRKTIAKRLSESIFTAPHFYLTIEIAMDEAMKSRATINTIPDTKVSFNDMVVKACAMALKKHPQVNSQWTADAMIINHHVNIGVAVAVEDGLVVPVLNFADQMSLTQIGASVRDLAGKAKTKKLTPAEMDGSTFTVSNLGMFGITEFTSIINQPNSAILSVGAIVEKPVVRNGQIVVGNTMKVTLACDHRTVDGATGAQFLQTLKQFVENPVTMLA